MPKQLNLKKLSDAGRPQRQRLPDAVKTNFLNDVRYKYKPIKKNHTYLIDMLRPASSHLPADLSIYQPDAKKRKIKNVAKIEETVSNAAEKIIKCDWHSEYDWPLSIKSLTEEEKELVAGHGGTLLRNTTIAQTQIFPSALSPSILKDHAEKNIKTYLTLWAKRTGHAFSLDGKLQSLGVSLTCFNETFVFPMLAESFDRFAQENVSLVESEIRQKMASIMKNAIWHDNWTNEKINTALQEIFNPNQDLPLWCGTGYDGHSIQIIFYRNYFVYCNRGAQSENRPGWRLFKIHNKNLSGTWLKHLVDRRYFKQNNYLNLKKIIQDLDAKEIFYCPMKTQTVGNCIYTSTKTVFSALLTLLECKSLLDKNEIQAPQLEAAVKKVKEIYKPFTIYDRKIVLEDAIKNIEELPANILDDENNTLKTEVVSIVAKNLYEKFRNTSSLMLKLGPELWKRFVNICEEKLIIGSLIDPSLHKLAECYEKFESNKILLELSIRFFQQKNNKQLWRGNDLLKLLHQKKLLGEALSRSKFIHGWKPKKIQQEIGGLGITKSIFDPERFIRELSLKLHNKIFGKKKDFLSKLSLL